MAISIDFLENIDKPSSDLDPSTNVIVVVEKNQKSTDTFSVVRRNELF
jgi:hypothetical protein